MPTLELIDEELTAPFPTFDPNTLLVATADADADDDDDDDDDEDEDDDEE